LTTHVHTAEQNFEPLCGVDTGMAISKLKKKKEQQLDMMKSWLN